MFNKDEYSTIYSNLCILSNMKNRRPRNIFQCYIVQCTYIQLHYMQTYAKRYLLCLVTVSSCGLSYPARGEFSVPGRAENLQLWSNSVKKKVSNQNYSSKISSPVKLLTQTSSNRDQDFSRRAVWDQKNSHRQGCAKILPIRQCPGNRIFCFKHSF